MRVTPQRQEARGLTWSSGRRHQIRPRGGEAGHREPMQRPREQRHRPGELVRWQVLWPLHRRVSVRIREPSAAEVGASLQMLSPGVESKLSRTGYLGPDPARPLWANCPWRSERLNSWACRIRFQAAVKGPNKGHSRVDQEGVD